MSGLKAPTPIAGEHHEAYLTRVVAEFERYVAWLGARMMDAVASGQMWMLDPLAIQRAYPAS